jgi:PA14 domain
MRSIPPSAWKGRAFLAAAVFALAAVHCGKKETPASTAASAPKGSEQPKVEGPLTLDPVGAKAADLKPGLKLTTFPNNTFSGSGEVSVSPTADFDCDRNPYHKKEVSLRYEGYLRIDTAGDYCFQTASDDQSTFSLNKKVILSQSQAGVTKTKSVALKPGLYELTTDYQNNVGPACLRVYWSSRGCGGFEPIPAAQLLH